MKKLLSIGCIMLAAHVTQAQDSTGNFTQKSVWRVLIVGFTNEVRLGSRTTLATTVEPVGYFGSQAALSSPNSVSRNPYYGLFGQISVAGRHFYNFDRRMAKGKSIRYNSGNYLSIRALYLTPALLRKDPPVPLSDVTRYTGNSVSMQALWGFQRTYRRNFYLNLGLGAGISTQGVRPALDFALGYTFPNGQRVQ
jgi:hypothetical protein